MSSLKTKISSLFVETFESCGFEGKFGNVVDSQRPDLGQFQCNGALAVAKSAKKNPREIAQIIVDSLENNPILKKLSIAGPGFINIALQDSYIANFINDIKNDPRLGCDKIKTVNNIVIDFGSPNVAKPMHVGHLRSTIIGDSLMRLFTFLGHSVIGDNHVGDWGTQMGMLICELEKREPTLPYFDEKFEGDYPKDPPILIADLEQMYPVASKYCKENEDAMAKALIATEDLQKGRKGYIALWKHFVNLSVTTLKHDFDNLGVTFDFWHGESFYANRMQGLVRRLEDEGHAVKSDGALIIPVAKDDDKKEIPPVMLVKSGGGFLYGTSDIATIEYRVAEFNVDMILYVVDKRQSLHFEQVFRAVKKTGIVKPEIILEHIGFGTVNGKDGKPFKTREGGVTKLCDLIEQVTDKAEQRMKEAGIAQDFDTVEFKNIARMVGVAAMRFADLMNHRTSNYVFDIDKFCRFEGKTGPYLQYTAVRIKSILRKTKEAGLQPGTILEPTDTERSLILAMGQLPDVLKSTAESYTPNYICDYTYTLSQEFNRFYSDCHILREENKDKQSSWLALAKLCLCELELLLSLLGIEIPERM